MVASKERSDGGVPHYSEGSEKYARLAAFPMSNPIWSIGVRISKKQLALLQEISRLLTASKGTVQVATMCETGQTQQHGERYSLMRGCLRFVVLVC